MKLSVVIPAFNASQWIREAVASVSAQDFTDWELIVVDDGSTDETPAIVDRLAAEDRRISAVHRRNAGPGVARNAGIDLARSDYLLFLDSDDKLASPTILTSMMERAGKTGCDVLLARARRIGLRGEPGNELAWCLRKDILPAKDVFSPDDVGTSLFFASGPVPWGKLFRRDLVNRERLRFPPLPRSEDFPFVQTAMACSDRIAVFDGVMVLHRTGRTDSLENTKDSTPLVFAEAERLFFKMLEDRGIWQKFSLAAKARALLRLSYNIDQIRTDEALDEVFAQLPELLDTYRLPADFREIPDVAGIRTRLDAMAKCASAREWRRTQAASRHCPVIRHFMVQYPSMPKVSIIIPVYNVEAYLRRSLDSVVNQTLLDIEVICVDDGSTDGSAGILREYAAKDSRVKILLHDHANAGAARNAGMAVATGEYLGFVDSDDWCELTLFEKAYDKAKRCDADVVSWRYVQYDVRTERTEAPRVFPREQLVLSEPFSCDDIAETVLSPITYAPWGRLVRRSFVSGEGLRFQEIARTNDVYFCCMVSALAGRHALVDEVLYTYRVGTGTNLQAHNAASQDSAFLAWQLVARELERRGMAGKFRKALVAASANSLTYTLNAMSTTQGYVDFFHRLRGLYLEDPFYSTIGVEDIPNPQTATYVKLLKEKETPLDFLVQQENYYRERLSTEYWSRVSFQRANDELEAKLAQVQHEKTMMERSASFRIGRMLTWVPRKLRDMVRRRHGGR